MSMTTPERERYRLHARLPVFHRRLEAAHNIIREGLATCERPFVACSFGKDSAVMLDLVRQHRPDIEARFLRWPETDLLGDYPAVIDAWREMGANIQVLDLTRARLDEAVPDRWQQLNALAPADGSFIGLRAQESRVRQIRLGRDGPVAYVQATRMWRICPLARWRTEDVAAYTVSRNLPTLEAYHRKGFEARTSSRVPRNQHSIRQEALFDLRQSNPAAWAQLAQLYPEVTDA